jgi:vacuolar-type H+-ATPase subunit H
MSLARCIPIVFALSVSPLAAALEEGTCVQHRDQFIESLDEERERSLAQVERSLAEISNATEQEHLRYQREQIWDYDEQMRGTADQIWRDCMQHVRNLNN